MLKTQIFEWHKHFMKGCEEVENDPKTEQPSTMRTDENITGVNQLVQSDRKLPVQTISEELSLNTEPTEGNCEVTSHDNTPAHKAISVKRLLTKKQITPLDHPPYSPDLVPCDFWLFQTLKTVMKGTYFSPKRFRGWQDCMQKCIDSEGKDIKWDNS